ncbi:hypothetical protein FRB90_007667, partial [Tulasnella sp. 427]
MSTKELQDERSPTTPAETIADRDSDPESAGPSPTTLADSQKVDRRDPYHVKLEGDEDPKSMTKSRKWMTIIIICSAATCVTCASSV